MFIVQRKLKLKKLIKLKTKTIIKSPLQCKLESKLKCQKRFQVLIKIKRFPYRQTQ